MADCNATLPGQKEKMINVGDTYTLKGCNGCAKIIRPSNGKNFFWAKIDWSGFRYDGQEFPFAKDGRYLGSVSWAIPDLILKDTEMEEVEL